MTGLIVRIAYCEFALNVQ